MNFESAPRKREQLLLLHIGEHAVRFSFVLFPPYCGSCWCSFDCDAVGLPSLYILSNEMLMMLIACSGLFLFLGVS